MNTQDIKDAMTAWKEGKVVTDKELQTCVDAMKQTLIITSFCEERGSIVSSFFQSQLNSMEHIQQIRKNHR